MEVPISSSRREWQPGHVPRLSYRTSTSTEHPEGSPQSPSNPSLGFINTAIPASRIPTGRQQQGEPPTSPNIQVTTCSAPLPSSKSQSSTASPQPQKKKNSLFSGLFAKEPSSAALEQIAAHLIAQHGELSARAVPGVSSKKMPDVVPKVNSKWNGVPEAAKLKEKQEKERSRAMKRQSNHRARSADSQSQGAGRSTSSRGRRNSGSTMSSFDSRGGVAERYRHVNSSLSRPASDAAQSSGEALPHRTRGPTSDKSSSLRSPSGSSLPEITSFFPNDIPVPPALPAKYRSTVSKISENSGSADWTQYNSSSRTRYDRTVTTEIGEPEVDAIPEHSSSPVPTPQERSPVTPALGFAIRTLQSEPFSESAQRQDVLLVSNGPNVLGLPVTAKRRPKSPANGFLAGEARPLKIPDDDSIHSSDLSLRSPKSGRTSGSPAPVLSATNRVQQDLENRPDSSRARLGLRASMVIKTDSVPWELSNATQDTTASPKNSGSRLGTATSQRLSMIGSPKSVIQKGLFSKDKNEK